MKITQRNLKFGQVWQMSLSNFRKNGSNDFFTPPQNTPHLNWKRYFEYHEYMPGTIENEIEFFVLPFAVIVGVADDS